MSDRRPRLGWWLSSEEHDPRGLVSRAQLAEAAGFTTAMISDHLHPWVVAQGHSPHVWTTVGAIAHATDRIEIGTGGNVPPVAPDHGRAGCAAILLEGRFFLGVGTGERLNEQAFGERWPYTGERRQWLTDGTDVLRQAFTGDPVSIDDGRWRVEASSSSNSRPARLRSASLHRARRRPSSPASTATASRWPRTRPSSTRATAPAAMDRSFGQIHVSLASTLDDAREAAWPWWPNGAIAGAVLSELATPSQFEAAAEELRPEAIEATVVCATGPDPIVHAVDKFVAAAFDTIYVHQIGPDQSFLLDPARTDLLPHYG